MTGSSPRRLIDDLAASAGLLTVLPVRPRPIDRGNAAGVIMIAPLAVLPIAAAAAALTWLARLAGLPTLAVGLVGVAALALGTRAFHLDGLADAVDALGSGWDRERALEIMKRGDIGPMGALAMIIVVGMQAVGFGTLVRGPAGALAMLIVCCLSRTALLICCLRVVPAARPGGLGALVAGAVARPAMIIIGLLALVIGSGLLGPLSGAGLVGGAIAVAAGLAAAALLVRHVIGRLGGVTGDVMGSAVEIAASVSLLALLIDYRGLP